MKGEKKYLLHKGAEMPHIGQLLQAYMDKHRTYQAALARSIQRDPRTIILYRKSQSIQAAILWELSHALEHNFFADLAAALPDTFTRTSESMLEQKDKEIATLQAEVTRLQQDKELLLRVAGGERK